MNHRTIAEAKAIADRAAKRLAQEANAKVSTQAQKRWAESLLTQARLRRMGVR
jgi:hypothetical protein